jgi:hypothetical protein
MDLTSFQDILDGIAQADEKQMTEIIRTVIRRFRIVFPGEEVIFLSLPIGESDERNKCIEAALKLMRKQK